MLAYAADGIEKVTRAVLSVRPLLLDLDTLDEPMPTT